MVKDIFLIIVGALIGICSTIFVEHKKRVREQYDRRDRGRQLLKAILEEVKIGIERCNGLSKRLDETPPSISFSRIYTGLWDSSIPELSKSIDDLEIIRLLNSVYYYFDLVNFNMNRNEFGIGAAFAKDKLPYLRENLAKLETKLKKIPDEVLFDTPILDRMVALLKQIVRPILQRKK